MKNYEDVSDFEINERLANLLGLSISPITYPPRCSGLVVYPHSNEVNFDPCNNPSDAWSIIVENEISINPHGSKWMVNNFNPSNVGDFKVQTCHYDKNPLRAAMICFLKMNDGLES